MHIALRKNAYRLLKTHLFFQTTFQNSHRKFLKLKVLNCLSNIVVRIFPHETDSQIQVCTKLAFESKIKSIKNFLS